MIVLFLGTGADDWPKKQEAEMTEHDRRRCSLLIDGHVLVDIAAPSYDFAKRLGVDTSAITDVVISHMHGDHYNKECLLKYRQDTPHNINIWCHTGAVEKLNLSSEEKELFHIHPVSVGEHYKVSEFKIVPLAANHTATGSEISLHYIFEKNAKHMFYGCDGGWFLNETWDYLRRIKLDGMILDATIGDKPGDFRLGCHNTIPMLKLLLAGLQENHILMEYRCILVADHLSLGEHETMEETERIFHEMGMYMAYDGLELNI